MKTQTDIARAAGVSLKTVSRVVNGDPLVKPETRERIERIFREMNYQPSVASTFTDFTPLAGGGTMSPSTGLPRRRGTR